MAGLLATILLAVVAAGILALPALLVVREVRALRAAGISDERPGCGKCRYRMRGWGTPVCPECGSDVREVGVVTGSRRVRGLAGQVALVAVVITGVVAYFVAADIARLSAVTRTTGSILLSSTADPRLFVIVEVDMSESWGWRGLWGARTRTVRGDVMLECERGAAGHAVSRRSIPFEDADGIPARAELLSALEQVASGATGVESLDDHAGALAGLLARLRTSSAVSAQAAPWAAPVVSYSVRRDDGSASLLFLLVPAIMLVVLAVVTDRAFPSPRSEPRDREWE